MKNSTIALAVLAVAWTTPLTHGQCGQDPLNSEAQISLAQLSVPGVRGESQLRFSLQPAASGDQDQDQDQSQNKVQGQGQPRTIGDDHETEEPLSVVAIFDGRTNAEVADNDRRGSEDRGDDEKTEGMRGAENDKKTKQGHEDRGGVNLQVLDAIADGRDLVGGGEQVDAKDNSDPAKAHPKAEDSAPVGGQRDDGDAAEDAEGCGDTKELEAAGGAHTTAGGMQVDLRGNSPQSIANSFSEKISQNPEFRRLMKEATIACQGISLDIFADEGGGEDKTRWSGGAFIRVVFIAERGKGARCDGGKCQASNGGCTWPAGDDWDSLRNLRRHISDAVSDAEANFLAAGATTIAERISLLECAELARAVQQERSRVANCAADGLSALDQLSLRLAEAEADLEDTRLAGKEAAARFKELTGSDFRDAWSRLGPDVTGELLDGGMVSSGDLSSIFLIAADRFPDPQEGAAYFGPRVGRLIESAQKLKRSRALVDEAEQALRGARDAENAGGGGMSDGIAKANLLDAQKREILDAAEHAAARAWALPPVRFSTLLPESIDAECGGAETGGCPMSGWAPFFALGAVTCGAILLVLSRIRK